MEIITGVERRRHWRPDEKLRILAELGGPGAKFVDVARRHEVSRGLLWQWRDAQRRGRLVGEEAIFVPVRVVPELPAPASPAGPTASLPCADPAVEHDDRIEIVLPDGTTLRVGDAARPHHATAAVLARREAEVGDELARVAARPSLVDELDGAVPPRKAAGEFADRRGAVLDRPDVPDLPGPPGIRHRDGDGLLVHVATDIRPTPALTTGGPHRMNTEKLEAWRKYYNEDRPHGAIAQKPPVSLQNPGGITSPPP